MVMQGEELKALRKSAGVGGMTQEDFARKLGMTATSVGLMERGVAPIERRTENLARSIHFLMNSHTMLALIHKLRRAAKKEYIMDSDELEDAADWLEQAADLGGSL